MAITLDHTEGNVLSFSPDAVPDKDEVVTAPIDAGDGAYYDYVKVQLVLAWAAGADGPATISVRYSADSGTTDSDTSIDILDVEEAAASNKTITITLAKFNFAEIMITNGTSAASVLTVSGKWEGLKVSDS